MKFLVRCIKNTKTSPQKAEIKSLTEMMVKASEDSFEPVRISAFEGLGTMMKVIGEKAMNTFLEGLDDIKKGKIKDYYDKAEVKIKFSTAKKPPPPAAAPSKGNAPKGKSAEKPAAKKEAVRHSFGIVNFMCINIIVKYFNSFCPLWGICFEGFCTQEGSCKTGRPSKKSSSGKSPECSECCRTSSKEGRKGEGRSYQIQIY